MTEGGRPAHRRERGKYPLRGNLHTRGGGGGGGDRGRKTCTQERKGQGKYPLRGNLHTEGGLQRDLHAKRRGDYPLRGNLHKQEGDNPAQKAREVCKQRKRHTCQTKEMTHSTKRAGKT